MSDDLERRSYLPWLMAVLIIVIGGAKLEVARPLLANALAAAVPVVPVAMGVSRLHGGDLRLERAAKVVGAAAILGGELCVAGGFFGASVVGPIMQAARYTLYAAVLGSLALNAAGMRRQINSRISAFVGIAAVFAIYVSAHPTGSQTIAGQDAFSRVFGAFFVALLFGGGGGLLAGEAVGRMFKRE